MDQFVEGFKEIAAERDYLQDVAIPYYSKGLDESLDEIIALKKERNEIKEKLRKQQECDTTYTDILAELVARTKANSKVKNVKEDIKKRTKNIDGSGPRSGKENS